jgi:uncharacterized protein (TIGR04141 family)
MKTLCLLRLSIILFLLFNTTLKASKEDLDENDMELLSSIPIALEDHSEKFSENDPQTEEQTQNSKISSNNSLSSSSTRKRKLSLNKNDSPQQNKKYKNNNNQDPNSLASFFSQNLLQDEEERTINNSNSASLSAIQAIESDQGEELDLDAIMDSILLGTQQEDELSTQVDLLGNERLPQFKVALLKQEITYKDALKEKNLEEYNIKGNPDGKIYFKQEPIKPCNWAEVLLKSIETGEDESLPPAISATAKKIISAVIFINTSNRSFAIPFGKTLLHPEALDPEFGLKVTLNVANPHKVKALGSQTIDYNRRATHVSYNIPSHISRFVIDTHALVKKITAEVDGDQGNNSHIMSGAGAYITIKRKVKIDQLSDICQKLLERSEDEIYKERYPWFNNIRPINDKNLIKELDSKLKDALSEEESNKSWYLSRPYQESMRDSFPNYYKISKVNNSRFEDLEAVSKHIEGLAPSTLKSKRLLSYNDNDQEYGASYPLYDLISFETYKNDMTYILHEGHWFKLDPNYTVEVDSYVNNLLLTSQDDPKLPFRGKKEKEGDYNRRVATNDNNFFLFDQRLVAPTTNNNSTDIEVCDLLSKDGHIIHVKGDTHSSDLSHLFSQGSVSANALSRDSAMRQRVREKYLRAELCDEVKALTKSTFKKIKQKWQDEISAKNWNEQMKLLILIDSKCFGNYRQSKHFKEEKIKKSYKNESETFKKRVSFDDYIVKCYKKYLLNSLQKKLIEACAENILVKNRDESLKKSFVGACVSLYGKNIINSKVQEDLQQKLDTQQDLLNKLLPTQGFKAENYTVVYAISTPKNESTLSSLLPFFSRVTLMAHAKELQSSGYKVAVKKVDVK